MQMSWILDNKEWVFSGIGVFLVGGLVAFLKYLAPIRSQNHPDLAIHTQHVEISARAFHENYDNALGVFIENTGDSPIHIHRALFQNRIPWLLVFRRTSELPVYPKAFKDAERHAYELKFGEQWYDPQTDIQARDRVMTYLPLCRRVADEECNIGKHGEVIVRYSSAGKAGTHKVHV